MASITATNLTSGGNGSSSSITTASISPTTNRLVLLALTCSDGVTISSVSGNGLTWVLVGTDTTDQQITSVYRALGSTSSGTISVSLSGSCRNSWNVAEFANINTTGTNGSGAIGNTAKAANGDSSNVSTRTATLSAFGSTDNATYGASSWNGNSGATTITQGSGFTELADADGTAAGFHTITETEFNSANDTTVDSSTSSTGRYVLFAIEIKNVSTMPTGFFLVL